jgi:hypothetical protein
MTQTPPGWHDDRHGSVRWWDGAQWTAHVQDPAAPVAPSVGYAVPPALGDGAPPATEVAPPASPPPRRRGVRTAVILGGSAVLIVILAVSIPIATEAAQKQAAIAAVELYYASWHEADCRKFEQATTANLETQQGFGNCDLFMEEARRWSYSIDDYDMRVTGAERVGDEFIVSSTETYRAFVDEDGKAWPDGFDSIVENTDRVIEEDGAWRVDYRR